MRFKSASRWLVEGYSGGQRAFGLLVALALAGLVIAAVAMRLLQIERIVWEEASRRADIESLKLVGHRAEDALLDAMQAPVTAFTKGRSALHGVPALAEVL